MSRLAQMVSLSWHRWLGVKWHPSGNPEVHKCFQRVSAELHKVLHRIERMSSCTSLWLTHPKPWHCSYEQGLLSSNSHPLLKHLPFSLGSCRILTDSNRMSNKGVPTREKSGSQIALQWPFHLFKQKWLKWRETGKTRLLHPKHTNYSWEDWEAWVAGFASGVQGKEFEKQTIICATRISFLVCVKPIPFILQSEISHSNQHFPEAETTVVFS